MAGDGYIDNPSAKFNELFRKVQHLPEATTLDRGDAYRRLDELGVFAFLELLAKGRLLTEIAIDLQVPVMYLEEWAKQNIDPAKYDEARRLGAEAFVVKSILPLTVTYDSPGQATIAKALSERMAWVAQRLDPDRWGDTKPSKVPSSPVNLVFKIGEQAQVKVEEPKLEDRQKSIKDTLNLLKTEDYVVVEDDEDGPA